MPLEHRLPAGWAWTTEARMEALGGDPEVIWGKAVVAAETSAVLGRVGF